MALLHRATLTPSKPDLLAAWIPRQPWGADLPALTSIGGYRLDDPDGEVGMEGILLRSADGAVVVHVPLTYRGAPLDGAEAQLVGTMEHSALGTRWVYDATTDPVWTAAMATAIRSGAGGAEEYFEEDGQRVTREPLVAVRGSGGEGDILTVVHVVGSSAPDGATLDGTWEGGAGVLVVLS